METESRTVRCGTHGEVGQAFVCSHLLSERSRPLGFFEPEYDPTDPDPQAWCGECEKAVNLAGDWTDEVAAQADIKLVCEFCFETMRGIHASAA